MPRGDPPRSLETHASERLPLEAKKYSLNRKAFDKFSILVGLFTWDMRH